VNPTLVPPPHAVSPELALVDPGLAAELRASLPEPTERPRVAARAEQPVAAHPPEAPLVPPTVATVRARRFSPLSALAGAAVVVAALAGAYAVGGLERLEAVAPTFGLSAQPAAAPSTEPRGPAVRPTPLAQAGQTFAWTPTPGASYYHVVVARDSSPIFEAWPTAARLTIPASWSYRSRRMSLTSGRYSWWVRPGIGDRSEKRLGRSVVRASFVVAATT
jgi:hypothetical protein